MHEGEGLALYGSLVTAWGQNGLPYSPLQGRDSPHPTERFFVCLFYAQNKSGWAGGPVGKGHSKVKTVTSGDAVRLF